MNNAVGELNNSSEEWIICDNEVVNDTNSNPSTSFSAKFSKISSQLSWIPEKYQSLINVSKTNSPLTGSPKLSSPEISLKETDEILDGVLMIEHEPTSLSRLHSLKSFVKERNSLRLKSFDGFKPLSSSEPPSTPSTDVSIPASPSNDENDVSGNVANHPTLSTSPENSITQPTHTPENTYLTVNINPSLPDLSLSEVTSDVADTPANDPEFSIFGFLSDSVFSPIAVMFQSIVLEDSESEEEDQGGKRAGIQDESGMLFLHGLACEFEGLEECLDVTEFYWY
ncbi:hypothetical protein HK098_008136 [Nowakowskiella sp. JEL0407]|nr:hypothetical protein HK098_008136 [Nowakowskiella sp. JEL0407]